MLNLVNYQSIVNRLISILGKNINIMDDKGIITASGDESRINTYHSGAYKVAQENKEIIIDKNSLDRYEGCKEGVNIPFCFDGKVQGVVGITGHINEVKGYGLIVKELVELMIQEEVNRQEQMLQTRAIKNFIKELIKNHTEEEWEDIERRAKLLQINMECERVVIIGDISNFTEVLHSLGEKREIKSQEIKDKIVKLINEYNNSKNDLVINVYCDIFVILKTVPKDIDKYCTELNKYIYKEANVNLDLAVGVPCNSIKDYVISYDTACEVLKLGRNISKNKTYYLYKDFRIPIVIKNISENVKIRYLKSFITKNFDFDLKEVEEILFTAKILIENDMNVKKASENSFQHRNTFIYRMRKYREQYGLDLSNCICCMELYMCYIIFSEKDSMKYYVKD